MREKINLRLTEKQMKGVAFEDLTVMVIKNYVFWEYQPPFRRKISPSSISKNKPSRNPV
jgi:hypothetical protein